MTQLLGLLDLAQQGPDSYQGLSPAEPAGRVFGGQVLAQALMAATATVEGRLCHSLHAYFLRPGNPRTPILYQVDRSRDGASFSARRVVAQQGQSAIFTMAASFQRPEEGFDHQAAMPVVPAPEDLEDDQVALLRDPDLSPAARAWVARERGFEIRSVIGRGPFGADGGRPKRPAVDHIWFRARRRLPDDPALHRALLAFMSDCALLDTALLPHGKSLFSAVQIASLDHAMWFHRDFRVDDWLLYTQESPSASGGRGFATGHVYTRDGRLVATVAQEGVIRQR